MKNPKGISFYGAFLHRIISTAIFYKTMPKPIENNGFIKNYFFSKKQFFTVKLQFFKIHLC